MADIAQLLERRENPPKPGIIVATGGPLHRFPSELSVYSSIPTSNNQYKDLRNREVPRDIFQNSNNNTTATGGYTAGPQATSSLQEYGGVSFFVPLSADAWAYAHQAIRGRD